MNNDSSNVWDWNLLKACVNISSSPVCFYSFCLLALGLYLTFQSQSVEIIDLMPPWVSGSLLSLYLDEYKEIPWDALKYVTAGVNYGSHVTDGWGRHNKWKYVFVSKCIQSNGVKTMFVFAEETHCGCTQVATSAPCWSASWSQSASTTKWTIQLLQPGKYRHSGTLMNTDRNT